MNTIRKTSPPHRTPSTRLARRTPAGHRPPAEKQATRKPAGPTPPGDHLAVYFRDLGSYGLLEPEQEQKLARDLEVAELATWQLLLGNPSTVEYLLALLEGRLDNSLTEFRSLRRAAAAARAERTKAARQRLSTSAGRIATQLRALDHDRQHVAALVAELERLQANGGHAPMRHFAAPRPPFSPKSRAFAAYFAEVLEAYQASARLRDEFVRANLRLVVTMARRYDRGAMPLSDLIQEGNLGLMHAVSRFDYRRGLRFSTYACWWIRHAIGRALADKARSVRVPVHMIEAQQQLAKVQARLLAELGRPPTRAEVAEAADVPLAKLNQMHRYLIGQQVSLDGPAGGHEENRSLGDILADPSSEEWAPEEDMTNQALAKRVHGLLHTLSPIEADVLKQRFGLDDDRERTFREIGDQYQLSRERIRQIQNAALGKLRRALNRE